MWCLWLKLHSQEVKKAQEFKAWINMSSCQWRKRLIITSRGHADLCSLWAIYLDWYRLFWCDKQEQAFGGHATLCSLWAIYLGAMLLYVASEPTVWRLCFFLRNRKQLPLKQNKLLIHEVTDSPIITFVNEDEQNKAHRINF